MGNHVAGMAVGLAAAQALLARKPGEPALGSLDRVCTPYRGCDAEFEAADPDHPDCVHPDYDSYTDPHPAAAPGLLMVEAFAPRGLADLPRYAPMLEAGHSDEESAHDAWRHEVELPFLARYRFC